MNISTGQELYLKNLISLRIKDTQIEINKAIMNLKIFLKDGKLKNEGPTVSVTYSIEHSGLEPILDMEILTPVDRQVAPPNGCVFKKKLHLVNAAYTRHEGKPETLQQTCNQLLEYLQNNSLQNITPLYSVMIKEPEIVDGRANDMVVDLYIGINPSTL